MKLNLPNSLTLSRIFLVPLFMVVLLTNFDGWSPYGVSKETLGAAIFAVASFTDWADGYLARRRKQVTPFGQWMDPLADKLLVTAALISLVQIGVVRAWMAAVILGREYAVTVLRSILHARGQALPASRLGKTKLVAQVVAILFLILGHGMKADLHTVGMVALWVAMIAAVLSGIEYSREFNTMMSRPPAPPSALRPAS